ncbi:FMN-binding protein MioC [Bowmanella sp. JS7-9]|uniref:FMN-binding protein MioC n=1 Tax=Pseudobowmanella zhangzhouensis TaxID=1537679 RepID=A0ABW1XQJ6_9ALTE|nr:FMN-binding protein MioC [Bowmanella sp. JS7-9]TBX24400.1 nitric oxide synthase [Bowmanella sp. JS7-9]
MQFEIIVGSMLGASEYVADALEAELTQRGAHVTIHLQPDLNELNTTATWILCSSTHGAGDLPDNIQPFAQQLAQANLADTHYFIVGLGDTSYDTFCFGAKQLDGLMQSAGAKAITDPLFIDVLEHPIPEDVAVSWIQPFIAHE